MFKHLIPTIAIAAAHYAAVEATARVESVADKLTMTAEDVQFNIEGKDPFMLSKVISDIEGLQAGLASQGQQLANTNTRVDFVDPRNKDDAPCGAGNSGQLRVRSDSGELQVCHGDEWHASYEQPLGFSRANPANSCEQLKAQGMLTAGVGIYWFVTENEGSDGEVGVDVHQGGCEWDGADTLT